MKTAVCTIAAKNYLPYARVLMASVERLHPDWRRFVVLVDTVEDFLDPRKENFEIVLSEDIDLPNSKWLHFKYNILELSTAVKPFALRKLFQEYALDAVIYLDPDIRLYERMEPVVQALERANIVLTPHLTDAITDSKRPSELDIMRSGAYNLGFIALANRSSTPAFLDWWCLRLENQCVIDQEKGLFVDQRWCDLVPGLFENVRILRDSGLNVAYWNIHGRRVRKQGEHFLVNNQPLYFFHFSGLDPEMPNRFSRHQDRFLLSDTGGVGELVLTYREELFRNGYRECKDWPYAYRYSEDGTLIPDLVRPVLGEVPNLMDGVPDPFSAAGFRAICGAWNHPVPDTDGPPFFTRLALRIYALRTDVRAAFPDIHGRDRGPYLSWLARNAGHEHMLPAELTAPFLEALQQLSERDAASRPGETPMGSADPSREDSRAQRWVSNLMRLIHSSRPDLREVFPDPAGRDRLAYLTWLCTYGRAEYKLDSSCVAMMHYEWESAAKARGSYLAVCWQRIRRRALGAAARLSPVEAAQNGNPLVFASTGFHLQENAWRDPLAASRPDLMALNSAPCEPGVNLVGYISAEMGIGQGARNLVRAARCAGLKCAVKPVSTDGLHREHDRGIEDDIDHPYPVNVIYVNADKVPSTLQALGEDFLRAHRNIGYWHWELEEFPEDFNSAFDCLDEVWTASRFCQDSISRLSPVPVIRIPHAVEVTNPPARSRSYFGLPEEPFLFLTVFDMLSVFERKNPLGVVRAFIEAFAGDPATHLAIKISNANINPAAMRDLSSAIQSYPITLIDRVMDREDVDALLQVSDCLVSLHRSEGFGLCLAEAMYLGKPVIATAYSGNTDFMTSDNSFLVGYRLSAVPEGCPPYRAGAVWANPILGEAVSQMQLVRTAELWRNTIGKRAQDHIRQHLSPSVVGTLVRQRIERLLRLTAVERDMHRSATLSTMPR